MILSFRHKGLRRFYETGDTRGIQVNHASKLRDILFALSYAKQAQDMALPGFRLFVGAAKRRNICGQRFGKLAGHLPHEW